METEIKWVALDVFVFSSWSLLARYIIRLGVIRIRGAGESKASLGQTDNDEKNYLVHDVSVGTDFLLF